MNFRVWYSTESFANYIIANTDLVLQKNVVLRKIYESDANNSQNFHSMPDHIKQILYLDSPDLIVEIDTEPIFSIEVSTEAGTGHNVFQRFARLAASVENNVPAFYIYPEAVIINRQNSIPKWDKINPLIFKALDEVMNIYNIPALFYYFPSEFTDGSKVEQPQQQEAKGLLLEKNRDFAGAPESNSKEMKLMFDCINEIIKIFVKNGVINGRTKLMQNIIIRERRSFMLSEYARKEGNLLMSPLSATIEIPTTFLINFLSKYESKKYKIGELLRSRERTIIYKIDAKFRGDPYPGALSAIDYLRCREGKSFEERRYNLVMAWGDLSINDEIETIDLNSDKSTILDFIKDVKSSESKNILNKDYSEIENYEIPRYYMQVRYGSTFSKVKHIRVYSYFADAILFPDGALWRDA